MLLQLHQDNYDNINKLLAYANENNMELSIIDDIEDEYALPGKPITQQALNSIITKGRIGETSNMEAVHNEIRNKFHAD